MGGLELLVPPSLHPSELDMVLLSPNLLSRQYDSRVLYWIGIGTCISLHLRRCLPEKFYAKQMVLKNVIRAY